MPWDAAVLRRKRCLVVLLVLHGKPWGVGALYRYIDPRRAQLRVPLGARSPRVCVCVCWRALRSLAKVTHMSRKDPVVTALIFPRHSASQLALWLLLRCVQLQRQAAKRTPMEQQMSRRRARPG